MMYLSAEEEDGMRRRLLKQLKNVPFGFIYYSKNGHTQILTAKKWYSTYVKFLEKLKKI